MSPGETRAKKIAGLHLCKGGSEDYKEGCSWTTDRDEDGRCKKIVCSEVASLPVCDPEDYDLDENFKMGGRGKRTDCPYTTTVVNGVRCKKRVCN